MDLEYKLKDQILIKELQRPGVVQAVILDSLGLQYQIRYWDNSSRECVWLFGDEIEPRNARNPKSPTN